jgi:hypothetical protein
MQCGSSEQAFGIGVQNAVDVIVFGVELGPEGQIQFEFFIQRLRIESYSGHASPQVLLAARGCFPQKFAVSGRIGSQY